MRILPILFNTDMVRAILDGRKTMTRRVMKTQPKSKLCYKFAGSHKKDIGIWGYPSKTAHEFWGKEFKLPDDITEEELKKKWNPQYHTDDILYVRETWGICNLNDDENIAYIVYKASENEEGEGCRAVRLPNDKFEKMYDSMAENSPDWRPSIHMPKEAARIWLKVKGVRVERLQEITEEQTEAEGFQFTPPCLSKVSEDSYCDLDGPCTNKIKYCDMSAGELFGKVLWDSTIKKSDLDRYGWDANPLVWVIEFERCEKPENF